MHAFVSLRSFVVVRCCPLLQSPFKPKCWPQVVNGGSVKKSMCQKYSVPYLESRQSTARDHFQKEDIKQINHPKNIANTFEGSEVDCKYVQYRSQSKFYQWIIYILLFWDLQQFWPILLGLPGIEVICILIARGWFVREESIQAGKRILLLYPLKQDQLYFPHHLLLRSPKLRCSIQISIWRPASCPSRRTRWQKLWTLHQDLHLNWPPNCWQDLRSLFVSSCQMDPLEGSFPACFFSRWSCRISTGMRPFRRLCPYLCRFKMMVNCSSFSMKLMNLNDVHCFPIWVKRW